MNNHQFIATFTILFLVMGFLLFGIHSVFAAEETDIDQTLRRTIHVNSEDTKQSLNMSDLINQLGDPKECDTDSVLDVFCRITGIEFHFEIVKHIHRSVYKDINDANACQYARDYPEDSLFVDVVTRGDNEAISLIQKALKERGLLGPIATGKLGNKTISALMDLAWLKHKPQIVFDDLNQFKIKKDMLDEIIGLKHRMLDCDYVLKNPLPVIDWQPGDVGQVEKAYQKSLIRAARKNIEGKGLPGFDQEVGKAKATGNVDVELQR